ncbi:MAG: GGDEF domain-containing protein [Acidimicrobiales bacterium]
MGRTIGVLHSIAAPDIPSSAGAITQLETVATQLGTRLGMLRLLADSQLQATTDSLTGLLNRRALQDRFRALPDDDRNLTAVMADLDQFKTLNDTFGHETGDRALLLFATTMRATLRGGDLLCRYGGEEFAVVLPHCDAENTVMLLERLQHNYRVALQTAGLPPVTATYGVIHTEHARDLDTLMRHADLALFEGKRAGRDRIVYGAPRAPNETDRPDQSPRHGTQAA